MLTNDEHLSQQRFNKICNFFAGDGHFIATILSFLNSEVEKGTKVIFFLEDEIKEKLLNVVSKFQNEVLKEAWMKNSLFLSVNTITLYANQGLERRINTLINIIDVNCNEQGLVICIQKANDIEEKFIKIIEKLGLKAHKPIKLIDCYEFSPDVNYYNEKVNNYTHILKTVGLEDVSVYEIKTRLA